MVGGLKWEEGHDVSVSGLHPRSRLASSSPHLPLDNQSIHTIQVLYIQICANPSIS